MSEDIIWQILDDQFCAFKAKFENKNFCKNEYNLTGMCNKMYCPLANGRYATIREEDGKLYLHIKTIERAHSPANLWEKIELPEDMNGALSLINENLAFWPKRFVNKVKERLVRLHQYLIRYRKWYYRAKPRLVTVHKKFERREQKRELKSLVAAKLDTQILGELQERFDQGIYDSFINLNHPQYMELLKEAKRREQKATRRKKTTGDGNKDEEEEGEKEVDVEEIPAGATFAMGEDDDEDEMEFVREEDDDLEPEMDDEEEDEDEEEEEAEREMEEEADPALRADIMKHIALSLNAEAGDDGEIRRLKRDLIQSRKRKLQQKQDREKKRAKDAQKKRKHYGAHVEIEYEPTAQTTTSTTSW